MCPAGLHRVPAGRPEMDPVGGDRVGGEVAVAFSAIEMRDLSSVVGTLDDILTEGNTANPVSTTGAIRTGHAFHQERAPPADP